MSRPDTCRLTAAALAADGHPAGATVVLRDVDLPEDAEAVAVGAPQTRFAATWRDLARVRCDRDLVGSDARGPRMSERTLTGVAARIDARIPRTDSFTSDLRGPRTTARVGVWLGRGLRGRVRHRAVQPRLPAGNAHPCPCRPPRAASTR